MGLSWNFEHTYTSLPEQMFARVNPEPATSPKLIAFNRQLAADLGLDPEVLEDCAAELLSGTRLPNGAQPIAMAYAGHQFGHFTRLGDGRAVLLGEMITPKNDRYDLHLKGSGQTPFSRRGDGKAALGPMLREFLISEAMDALGVPTTRSLAVVATGDPVYRERVMPGAVLSRIAASHIRVGTFEFAARLGREATQRLADYTIQRHYPELSPSTHVYHDFLQSVISRQAALIAQWMKYGFIHGVMNTDNMAISGETIDFGPCAFMDHFKHNQVFSSIDHQGRYSYDNQPRIALWNLARFAETLLPLLHEDLKTAVAIAEELLSAFMPQFEISYFSAFGSKLGIFAVTTDDRHLIREFVDLLQENHLDFTNSFRLLESAIHAGGKDAPNGALDSWKLKWRKRLVQQSKSEAQIQSLMRQNNPAFIPRNHLVERALVAAENQDYELFTQLRAILSRPFEFHSNAELFGTPPIPSEVVHQTFCGT